jgi:hypothetical protein
VALNDLARIAQIESKTMYYLAVSVTKQKLLNNTDLYTGKKHKGCRSPSRQNFDCCNTYFSSDYVS